MRSLFRLLSVILTLILFHTCAIANDVVNIKDVASLVNPSKLSTLKADRAANPRFRKLMYYIHEAEKRGITPKIYIAQIYAYLPTEPYSNPIHVYAPKTEVLNLEAQYKLGKLYGLYTPENLARLRKGNSPILTKGEHAGQKAHVDHLLAVSKYPQLRNSMANLTWLPASLNLRKSDKLTNAAVRRLRSLNVEVSLKRK